MKCPDLLACQNSIRTFIKIRHMQSFLQTEAPSWMRNVYSVSHPTHNQKNRQRLTSCSWGIKSLVNICEACSKVYQDAYHLHWFYQFVQRCQDGVCLLETIASPTQTCGNQARMCSTSCRRRVVSSNKILLHIECIRFKVSSVPCSSVTFNALWIPIVNWWASDCG